MWQDTTRWNERREIPQETCRHSIMESEVGLFNFEGWMTNLLMWNLNFPLMDRIYVWGERKHNPFRPKGTAWVRTWKSENMGLGKLKRQDKHVTIMGIKIAVWVWGRTYRVVHPGERVRFSWQTTGATERGRPQATGASGTCWAKLERAMPVGESQTLACFSTIQRGSPSVSVIVLVKWKDTVTKATWKGGWLQFQNPWWSWQNGRKPWC